MLAMAPAAAVVLTRAHSSLFMQAFITLDSQHGSLLSDSMTQCFRWRSRQQEAVAAWISNHLSCSLLLSCLKLGPRLTKSNLEYVILQGSQFHRTKWRRVLQRCSRWLDLVPRWAGQRLLFASDDFFLQVLLLRLKRSSHALPRPP